MRCLHCHSESSAGGRFCIHCGRRLSGDAGLARPAETRRADTPVRPSRLREDDHECVLAVESLSSAVKRDDDDDDPFTVGEMVLDEYRVERPLGRGGMGVVYLVRRQSDGRPFALKTAHTDNDSTRSAVLRELRTWIDLPRHPHLAACHFFRTIRGRSAIFAEYVEGGSLHDAIQLGKLTDMARLLDFAIQAAWGLHAAHEAGVIHRDVKPSNLLISHDGTVKVCDFGISSARLVGASRDRSGSAAAHGTHGMAMSPPYCSPEQARGRPLTRATDQWSWGLSVLQMFLGARTWSAGQAAPHVLEEAVSMRYDDSGHRVVPPEVVDVLRRCFEYEPSRRWPDMLAAANALCDAERRLMGRHVARRPPDFPSLKPLLPDKTDPRGSGVRSAADWLRAASQADGGSAAEADALLKPAYFSQPGQLADELAGLDEARRIFERLIDGGRRDLLPQRAELAQTAGHVHRLVGDFDGALLQFGQAIEIYEDWLRTENQPALQTELISAWVEKGRTLTMGGRRHEAAADFDQIVHLALARWPRPMDQDEARHRDFALAWLFFNKGNNDFELGDLTAARGLFDRAIRILLERITHTPTYGDVELLKLVFQNQATVLSSLGEHTEAHKIMQRTAEVESWLREGGDQPDDGATAWTLSKQALVLAEAGDISSALAMGREVVAKYKRLVQDNGRDAYAPNLAKEYMNLANTTDRAGLSQDALVLYDRAIAIFRELVSDGGRHDLAYDLAKALLNKVIPLRKLGRFEEAMRQLEELIALLERERQRGERPEVLLDLAFAWSDVGYMRSEQGRRREALDAMQRAQRLLRRLIYEMGRSDLKHVLDGVEQNLRNMA